MHSFSPVDLSPPAQMIHFLHQWNPLNVVPGTSWSSVKFQPLILNWGHLSVIPLLIEESSHTCWISSSDSRNQQETNRSQAVRTHNDWCNWKSSALPLQSVPALDLKLYCRTFRLHSAATVLWDIMSHNSLHLYSQVKAYRYLYTTLAPAAVVLANFAVWMVLFRAKEKSLTSCSVRPDWTLTALTDCGCNTSPTFRSPSSVELIFLVYLLPPTHNSLHLYNHWNI